MSTLNGDRLDARIEVGKSLIELEQSAIIELYEFYYNKDFPPFRFHAGTNGITKDIIYGKDSSNISIKYMAIAVEVEGFEVSINGRLPRPKVTVANVDSIISSIMRNYSDFRDSRFVRIKLFLKHLDNENFEGGKNPFGTPSSLFYISKEKFLISQKLIENNKLIQFELITPFDLENLQIANRAIYGRYCYWQYRGSGCQYKGDLIQKEDGSKFSIDPVKRLKTSSSRFVNIDYKNTAIFYKWNPDSKIYAAGDIVSIANEDFSGIKDPAYTFFVCVVNHVSSFKNRPAGNNELWEKDGCAKTISACRDRFLYASALGVNDAGLVNGVLPFGGFPGTDSFSYE